MLYFIKFLKPLRRIANLFFFLVLITGCLNYDEKSTKTTAWEFQSQRSEIEPKHWIDYEILFNGEPTLALSGDRKIYTNGSWVRTFNIVPEKHYEFSAYFTIKGVEQYNRSVMAQLTWQSLNGDQVGTLDFPVTNARKDESEWYNIKERYQAPKGAVKVKVDLIYRWDADGKVFFGGTTIKETDAIKPRLVRLAAIHHRPKGNSSTKENLEEFKEYIEMAGRQKADIVCLSEGITMVGTGKNLVDVAEPIPGPTTKYLGEIAKKYNMYIVAGISELDGLIMYNTAVLIGRNGDLIGKYRKVSLPIEDINIGLTPGNTFPVFDTDFGTIGMMICWDSQFPEVARMLSLNGAEIVFLPIWGGDITLVAARSIENQVYIVSSGYDMKTGVFDRKGRLVVEGTNDDPIAIIEIDLNHKELLPWVGDFKNRIQRELPNKNAIQYE